MNFGVTRNTYSAHSKFSENTQAEKMVDGSGKPDEPDSSSAQIGTLLEEQRQTIIAEYREKVCHHELQAAHAEEERRILQEEICRQQKDFREVHQQSLTEMEELRKLQSSTFDTLARRKLIEDQSTILEFSGRVQELQNEVNCMNDSKDFQEAESVRSGNSHVTSRPVSFPPHPIPEGMLRHSFVSPSRREGPSSIWDTHGTSGNAFAGPLASSSAPYPQELNPWSTTIEEPLHMSTAEKSERPEQNRDLRCQSGPSAKYSVIFSGGDSSKNYEIDEKGFHGELCSSDRTGKPVKLSEDIRVKHAHDGTGQPVEQNSSSTHIVKEQFVPEENRDNASFNADNEFNREIDEENIDFNIPGVPNSTVKRSHGVNVRNLIQKIENHPQRQALQSDLQQHRQFNPFSRESQDAIQAAGNTELCEIVDVEPKAQCKACLSYCDVGIVYCTCGHFLRDDTTEHKKYIKSVLHLFSIPNFYIRKGRPHGHRYGKKEGDQEYHTANQLQKKCKKRQFLCFHDRFIRDTWFR